MKRKDIKIFFRSAFMTAVVLFCITAVFLGICKSWEEIRRISFKEDIPAISIDDGRIRILDFELKIS